jgi:hypothetical protein
MNRTQPKTNLALFALGLVSILFGMVLFEVLWIVEYMPAWTLLPAFFAAGIVFKVIEGVKQQEARMQFAPWIVTVEFDWVVPV